MEGQPLDDDELIRRTLDGDVHAYELLVKRHKSMALRTAYLIAGPDGEDAAQEAFINAYRSLRRFKAGSPFRPWLLRIVRNEALNKRRSTGRREVLALRAGENRQRADAAPSAESAVLAREERAEMIGALNRLSEKDRLLIGWRYLLDLTEEEMSRAMRAPRGTVKSRLSRAMSRLRAEMGVRG